jgi:uncharacterized protein
LADENMDVEIAAHPEGCLLAVRAQPGARKNAVIGAHDGALKIAVTAPPEDGRANEAATALLRDWLGLKRSQVDLYGGTTNRNKHFLIRGAFAGRTRGAGEGETPLSAAAFASSAGCKGEIRGALLNLGELFVLFVAGLCEAGPGSQTPVTT